MRLPDIVARAKLWRDDERATSPTIGSVLLVGITVVLASTVGAQMYDVSDTQQGPFAIAPVEFDSAEDEVTVTWMSNRNAETLSVTVYVDDEHHTVTLNDVGHTVTVDASGVTVRKGDTVRWGSPSTYDGAEVTVVVTATKDGTTVVLSEQTETV
jgi:flagellin-like protein